MIADNFTEGEIQALIIDLELEDPIGTANNNHYSFYPKTRKDAESYFFGYFIDSSSVIRMNLLRKGLYDEGFHLTQDGREIARKMRIHRPPIYYWYRRYYSAIENSQVFAKFNEEVYGVDIGQFGFSGTRQYFYGKSYDAVFSDISKILRSKGILAFITSENHEMEASLGRVYRRRYGGNTVWIYTMHL